MPRYSYAKSSSKRYASKSSKRMRSKSYRNMAYSLRKPIISGGARRIVKISRHGIDKIIGNQNSTNFNTYNTNGTAQVFDQITLGLTASSWNSSARFPVNLTYSYSDVAAFPEISRLYSQYRITGVKVTVIPLYNNANSGGMNMLGECTYAMDYADNTTATDENEVLEMQGAVTKRLDRPFSFFLKPVARGVSVDFAGGTTPNGVSLGTPWFDTQTAPDAQHFGTKMYFNNVNIGNQGTVAVAWKIRTKYYLEVKDST